MKGTSRKHLASINYESRLNVIKHYKRSTSRRNNSL